MGKHSLEIVWTKSWAAKQMCVYDSDMFPMFSVQTRMANIKYLAL